MISRPYISLSFWTLWDQELKVLHSGSLYLCMTQTFKIQDHTFHYHSGDYETKNLKRLWDQELKVIHSGSYCLYLCMTQTFKIQSSLQCILSRFIHHCNTSQISRDIQRTQHCHCWNAIKGDAEVYKDPWSTRTKSAPGGTKTLSVLVFGSDSHMQWCALDSLFIFYCSATDGEVQIDHHGVNDKMLGQELQRRKLLSCWLE